MAAPRSAQAHQKRVQKIVEEAADKVSQSSPIEEEVVVTIEELPPDEGSSRTSSSVSENVSDQARRSTEDATNAWLDVTKRAFDPELMTRFWDPRTMVESSFRFYEELLAVQKDFALKLADAIPARS
jgi:hypothetical protein